MNWKNVLTLLAASLLFAGCAGPSPGPEKKAAALPVEAIAFTSTAFASGQPLPKRHTGDGEDLSPALAWDRATPGTRSFALICTDPDAPRGTFTHWVIYNIPDTVRALPEGVRPEPATPAGAIQGTNDFGTIGYKGPSPPPGKAHRYFFRLYALDTILPVQTAVRASRLEEMMKGHVLASGELMGTYRR